jgi:hypothetical protein
MKRMLTLSCLVVTVGIAVSWPLFFDRTSAYAEEADATTVKTEGFRSGWAEKNEKVLESSQGCLQCHDGTEKMHVSETVELGCTDCHGGNAKAATRSEAHVLPKDSRWATSANPKSSYAALNKESPEFIQFMNPGDLRIAHKSCGKCHEEEVMKVRKSIMTHSATVPGTAAYNNGIAPIKNFVFGESYDESGLPQVLKTVPPPTEKELKRGVVPQLLPIPDFARTFPGNIFRVFEDGNNGTSVRGPGTENRIDAGFIALSKVRLNDPYLSFLGQNAHPGDYRQSGCTACHVVYANDSDPVQSGKWAKYGHKGNSFSDDPVIPKDEPGHPIKHQMTRSVPTSQCLTCHYHQGSGGITSYTGYLWWDYESDASEVYANKDHIDYDTYLETKRKTTNLKFADYANNGWLFRAVWKRDIRGNLLDKEDKIIPNGASDWMSKAVHLKDVHAEKGLHCIDCHFKQDSHGDGRISSEMSNAIEINCEDCHGSLTGATLVTSNPAGGNKLELMQTAFGKKAFTKRGDTVIQRSRLDPDKEWEIPQQHVKINPNSGDTYNKQMAYAHTIQRDGSTWGVVPEDPKTLAHRTRPLDGETDVPAHERDSNTLNCYSCHTSWVTSCYGCHLPNIANVKADLTHFKGETTFNLVGYYAQSLRSDGFSLGINGWAKGNRVAPVRSASAVIASAQNRNREWVFNQQPTISAEGFSGHAFVPFPPHTVRKDVVKQCSSCHISAAGDNNAKMAQVLGLGTNSVNFIGQYAYVASGSGGVYGVEVTEGLKNQPVIGSQFHSVARPDSYKKHQANARILEEGHHHGSRYASSVQKYGEYLFVADGSKGVRVFDIANIANKGFAQRLIEGPFSSLGHKSQLRSADARAVRFASLNPVDPSRKQFPENMEQKVQPLFGYGYVADFVEGLIVFDVVTYIDGNPSNNFPKRWATLNPNGILSGAVNIRIVGNYAYVLTSKNGLVIVDISEPTQPKVVTSVGAGQLNNPHALATQFRYCYVADDDGIKVFEISNLEAPVFLPNSSLALEDARDIYFSRTFAYVAAGRNGLAILDVTKITEPKLYKMFNADGAISDASGVVIGMTNTSTFAYIADGMNGLRIVELINSKHPGHFGYAPYPENPELIATFPTKGRALAVSEGLVRDRYVDDSGNQISVFNRKGSRPFNLKEMHRMYMRDSKVYFVTDEPTTKAAEWKEAEKKEEPKKEKPGKRRRRRKK